MNEIENVILCQRKIFDKPYVFEYVFNDKPYHLAEEITSHIKEILESFGGKTVYDNVTVRLDDVCQSEDNKVKIFYSLTSYFNTLLTNRSLNLKLSNGKTVREICEPEMVPLSESKLSNHIGYVGFVEFSDGKIVYVKRGKKLSTSADKWQPSISASLKTKYCFDADNHLSDKGLSEAIRNEIFDELKIKVDENEELSKSIFGFYRDPEEGGKPHFVFYYKCNMYDSESFVKSFNDNYDKEKDKINLVDGDEFVFFNIKQIKNSHFENNTLHIDNKEYATNTSFLIALEMLKQSY